MIEKREIGGSYRVGESVSDCAKVIPRFFKKSAGPSRLAAPRPEEVESLPAQREGSIVVRGQRR